MLDSVEWDDGELEEERASRLGRSATDAPR